MEKKLPQIDTDDNLTTKQRKPPAYSTQTTGHVMMTPRTGATEDTDDDEDSLSPQAPNEPDMTPPACLTDGSRQQIPRDYIKKWTVTDGNKEQRLKELDYTIDLLTSLPIDELVTKPENYTEDFQ